MARGVVEGRRDCCGQLGRVEAGGGVAAPRSPCVYLGRGRLVWTVGGFWDQDGIF